MTPKTPENRSAKDRLIRLRAELVEIAQTAAEGRSPVELDQTKVGRLSRMDALQDQAMQVEVENRRQQEIQRIDAALARIETGEYGFCISCGDDIEDKRLDLDPAAPLCHGCAETRKG